MPQELAKPTEALEALLLKTADQVDRWKAIKALKESAVPFRKLQRMHEELVLLVGHGRKKAKKAIEEQAVRVKRIQVRGEIREEKKRLDEYYRLLGFFSKKACAASAFLVAMEESLQRISVYEMEEASLAEEEGMWKEVKDK